ncbi:MAG: uridine kinase [Myxococcota bacterium]
MKVVGIAGGTASGKSTITRALVDQLGERALHITHDRYYRSLPDDFRDDLLSYNFDHPDALETERLIRDLAALRDGRPVQLVDYDFGICRRKAEEHWIVVEPTDIVVVEGILVLAVPELRGMFDHAVFVHADADLRLARRLRRDIVERGDTPHGVIDQYLATVRPMHDAFVEPSRAHADLVVDGTVDVRRSIAGILDLIR